MTQYLQNPRGNEYGNPELCDQESELARTPHWHTQWGPRPRPGTCFLFPITELSAPRGEAIPPESVAPSIELPLEPPAFTPEPTPTPSVSAGEPMVSVTIPTHDRPEWLRRSVGSALSQTLSDIEILVVNDAGASVDDLLAELDSDQRITSIRFAENRERSNARNAGLALARGRYIAYLDDDDWWEADHLEAPVEELERTDAVGAYRDARTVVETMVEGLEKRGPSAYENLEEVARWIVRHPKPVRSPAADSPDARVRSSTPPTVAASPVGPTLPAQSSPLPAPPD